MDEEEIKRRVIFGNEVGYGKPPRHNQFQKGQSGNPKGRPKKAEPTLTDQPMLSAVLAIANKLVPVRDGGEIREMSMLEAVVTATATGAVKGNSRSQETFINLAQKAQAAEIHDRRRSIEIWTEYKRIKSVQIAEATKRGEPAPTILPHPDDIVIDYTNGPRFLGPMDDNEQAKLNETIRYRDALLMQDALDHRSTVRLDGEPLTEPGSAGVLAVLLERAIPPRLRLSSTEWLLRTMKYDGMPKRELLKLLFNTWQRVGTPCPRGFVLANLSWTTAYLSMAAELLREINAGDIDPIKMPQEEFAGIIRRRAEQHGITVE